MNQQLIPQQQKTPVAQIGMASGVSGAKIAPQNLGEVVRFAEVMARADIALPKHLRNNAGACMAVALQALEWEMSPFAVASKSYEVGGRIAYEAQLIAAVVNTRSGIEGRLRYTYEGEGASLQCTVTGTIDGQEYSYTSPRFDQITTKNSPLWKSDPEQQLGYYSARSWARRYTPEVLLGVYDREEAASMKDVTPEQQSLADRLKEARQGASMIEHEGFDPDHVTREIGQPAETTAPATPEDQPQSDVPPSSDARPSDPPSSDQAAPEGGDSGTEESPPSPSLIACCKDFLAIAVDERLEPKVKQDALAKNKDRWKALIDEADHNKIKQFLNSANAIIKGEADHTVAVEFYADMLGCAPADLGAAA